MVRSVSGPVPDEEVGPWFNVQSKSPPPGSMLHVFWLSKSQATMVATGKDMGTE